MAATARGLVGRTPYTIELVSDVVKTETRPPYTIELVSDVVKTETRPPDRERQGPPAFNPAPDQDQHLDRDSCGTSRGEFVPNLARGSSASIGATKQHGRSERKGER
jgi:hypothetical protein